MASASPELWMRVGAVCTRRSDLGDELIDGTHNEVRKAKGHSTFARLRSNGPISVGPVGLEGSMEYHKSSRAAAELGNDGKLDRAVLVQTAAHLRQLREYAASVSDPPLNKPLPEDLGGGSFGDNVFLEGGADLHSGTVCIGDEFEVVRGGTVVCRLQVSSSRRPCSSVDAAFGDTNSLRGVRAECARTGMGGIFCRVLTPGTIQAGDTWRLTRRPHPLWSLRRISALLYGDNRALMR
jgi:MOSC domain-containing protein YiiM